MLFCQRFFLSNKDGKDEKDAMRRVGLCRTSPIFYIFSIFVENEVWLLIKNVFLKAYTFILVDFFFYFTFFYFKMKLFSKLLH